MKGNYGKILLINLSTNEFIDYYPPEEYYRLFLGGAGLGARLFFEFGGLNRNLQPFDPEMPLMILAGPLVGTTFAGTSRFSVCSRSPLTTIWGESSCGGDFGPELKKTGYDGFIITGASNKPVYLEFTGDKPELKDASWLWGKNNYAVQDELKEKYKDAGRVKVLSIGQAGENKVLFANICNDKGDFAGRTGMGAVMGSKMLKAIVVKGNQKIEIYDTVTYKKLRKEIVKKVQDEMSAQSLREMGTASSMDLGMMLGDIPVKNWTVGEAFEISENISGPVMSENYLVKNSACTTCPIGCKRVIKVNSGKYQTELGPGPEYETCAAFGPMLLIDNFEAVMKINEFCNQAGIDTISAGSVVALAVEASDKGFLPLNLTDGHKLEWNNPDQVLELLNKIVHKQGIGELLAQGSREFGAKINESVSDLSVQVKGLDLPMHDPRAFHGMGLSYAVSNRGACHMQHMDLYVEQGMKVYDDIGLKEDYEGAVSQGKAEMTYISENFGQTAGSSCMCMFVLGCLDGADKAAMLSCVTGYDYDIPELLKTGARIWFIKRAINNIYGITKKDDKLPRKVLTALKEGGAVDSIPDIDMMLSEYYKLRKLDNNGQVTKSVLKEHDLDFVNDFMDVKP